MHPADHAAVECIRREFSRKGVPDEPAPAQEVTFWSGYGYGHLSLAVIMHDFYDAFKQDLSLLG